MERKTRFFLITTIVTMFFCMLGFNMSFAQTISTEEGKKSYTYVLKDENDTNRVIKLIKELYSDLEIDVVHQIGLITVNFDNELDLDKKIEDISNNLRSFIESEGKMPKLISPKHPINEIPSSIVTLSVLQGSPETKQTLSQKSSILDYPKLNSPYFSHFNWYLKDVVGNYETESIQKGDNSTIALIDSGVDINHPLLKSNIDLELAKDYTSDSLSFNDTLGHGTQVAGIIASIAPNSKITPYKVLGETNGKSIWVIQAIIDAAEDNADIINLSLGTYLSKSDKESKVLIKSYDKAIKYAKKLGSVVIASAGNESSNLDELKKRNEFQLPGGSHHLITVSSNSKRNTLSSYSNYGKEIEFSAPGGDLGADYESSGFLDISEMIITTYPIDRPNTYLDQLIGIPQGYTLSIGTSLSTPQVSAAVALIVSEYRNKKGKNPNVSQVEKYLKDGSIDLGSKGKDIYFGEGKINVYNSLKAIK